MTKQKSLLHRKTCVLIDSQKFFFADDGTMTTDPKARIFDLEERMIRFAENVRAYAKILQQAGENAEEIDQLRRSASAIGANYVEANQSLGRRDFIMRTKIAKKEASECRYWLRLIEGNERKGDLIEEVHQLVRILASMIRNVEGRTKKS